jgi:hypothetical protein
MIPVMVRTKAPASACAALLALWLAAGALPARAETPPHLQRQGTTEQLIVHDKPFLILGGELANSSASSRDYLKPAWDRFSRLHMNTVLAPVSW